jgi:DNA-binding transcriptional LysR family regulator
MGVDAEDVRYFHVLAQAGTLVRAAKELGVDHTTVSRRVRRLEAALDLQLFTRTRSGWTISPNGERLLPAAPDGRPRQRRLHHRGTLRRRARRSGRSSAPTASPPAC